MGAPQYEQAGADIGGSGTTNTIPRWTGASTLGDSGITDNGTTVSFVGRNLASTAVQTWTLNTSLSLLSGITGFYNAGTDGTYGDVIYIGAAAYPTTYRHRIKASVSATTTNALMTFSLNSGASSFTDVMTLRGDGNVGVGTASPIKKGTIKGGDLGIDYGQALCFTNGGTAVYTADAAVRVTFSSPNDVLQLQASGSSDGIITFHTGAAAALRPERARIDSNGNIYGTSGTTGMTNGFFYIPAAAGAPTGAPTAVSGRVPMYYDTTNNQFYVYNGAWKKVTLA